MKQFSIKNTKTPLILSFIISAILIVAAIAKMRAPTAAFPDVSYATSIFEIFFSLILILFFSHWEMWALAAIIFASWAGFSCFWMVFGIPCSCFGSWALLPPGILFTSDMGFVVLSALMASHLGAFKWQISKVLWFCMPMTMLGFVFAQFLYNTY